MTTDLERVVARIRAVEDTVDARADLVRLARPLAEAIGPRLPTRAELRDLTSELGLPIARETFMHAITRAPGQAAFQQSLRSLLQRISQEPRATRYLGAPVGELNPEVLIIASPPAGLARPWLERGQLFVRWVEELGLPATLVRTERASSLAGNARRIDEHLAGLPIRPRLVLTYGQGSAEFRYWYERRLRVPRREVRDNLVRIGSWIDICGQAYGSALAQLQMGRSWPAALRRLRFRLAGEGWAARTELASPDAIARDFQGLQIAEDHELRCFRVVGIPESEQDFMASTWAQQLSQLEPNDGRSLLTDSLGEDPNEAGVVVPVRGLTAEANASRLRPIFEALLEMNLPTA